MKKRNRILILLVTCILFIGIGIFISYVYFNHSINFELPASNEKISLQTIEVNTKIKEGIYMTDVSEVVENVMPSIVSITSKTLIKSGYYGPGFYGNNTERYAEGAGSGIIISNTNDELLVLTNNHVVDGSSELTVKFIDDKEVDATIKGTSERKDIAVISIKISDIDKDTLNNIKVAVLGDSNELKVGNGIIAIGNALGYGQSVTTGVVSALNRTVTGDDYDNKMIQIDAAINGGNSGGALLNNKGEVVGINSAKYSSSGSSTSVSIEGMGFAIPITDVKDLITKLMNGEDFNNGITLGIEGYITSNSNYYNLPEGFYISKIQENSYASKSELEIGYIITEIDGNKISKVVDISNVLYEKKKGDTVTLKIKYVSGREYKEKNVIIKL